jgi:FO synthase
MAWQAAELEQFPALTWDLIAPQASVAIRGALERVLEKQDGAWLTDEERYALANCDGADLLALLVAADTLRRDLVGNIVSYVVNRNINFTNICFVGCKFCAFSRGPREADSYFHSLEDMGRKAKEAWELGATEVCIQGGLPRDLPPFYYRDILRAVKNATPDMHIHAFSPMEIVYGVELTGMTLRDYLMMLRDNGLDTLPGTAAEILDDEVRHVLSRNKLSSTQWQEVIRTAHACGIPSTSTLMYGHRETPDHWVRQLSLFRQIQTETGGFTEFVPLGFVHQNTLLFQQGLARTGPTLAEHLKIHALARILLAGSIRNIQVSWVKLDRKLSQLCLRAGANDYGGTLMEESISREAGATAGEYTSPEDFQALILEIGRIPAERNTKYSRIKIKLPVVEGRASSPRQPWIRYRTYAGAGVRMSRAIAVIGGTGPAGMGLALRWARAGETVIIGSRDAARAEQTAETIRKRAGANAQVSGLENSAACAASDLLVLTVPFEGQAALLKQLKPAIRPGSIVIDATVPLAASVGGRASRTLGVWQGSAAQQTAELVPKGVSVAAAFQNVSADVLNGNSNDDVDCDVIVCSDDPNATQVAMELAAKIAGVRAIDGGKLENARIVELITALLIGLNIRHKGHGGIRITGLPDGAYRLSS